MKWLDNIRKAIGKAQLPGKINRNRITSVSNFHNARGIALLYEEKGEGFFILVKQYVKYLKSEYGIRDVMALSYIDSKKSIPHYHIHRLKYDYFHKGELNWRFEPTCDQVKNFVKNDYDILINLEREPSLPLMFVLAESRAKLKVGYYKEWGEDYYDIMLDLPETTTFDEYINQVNHYLTRINHVNERA